MYINLNLMTRGRPTLSAENEQNMETIASLNKSIGTALAAGGSAVGSDLHLNR